MTQHERPQTAGDFLRVWYALNAARDTAGLEKLESQFPELAETAPDMTLDILRERASSDARGATEAAAIYTRYVFHSRPVETTDLLVTLSKAVTPTYKKTSYPAPMSSPVTRSDETPPKLLTSSRP